MMTTRPFRVAIFALVILASLVADSYVSYQATAEYDRQQNAAALMAKNQELDIQQAQFEDWLARELEAQQLEFNNEFEQQRQDFDRQLKVQKKAFDNKLRLARREVYLMALYNVCWIGMNNKHGPEQAIANCVPFIQEGVKLIDERGFEPKPGWGQVNLNPDRQTQ